MSLISLKFVFAFLLAVLLITSVALAGEILKLPRSEKGLALWILGIAGLVALAALAAPVVGGLGWFVFGQ